jgi:hypothetical protein
LRVVGEFVGKKLQGDVATELEVFRLVDHTHATAADPAQYAVMGNRLPNGLGGRGHWVDMLGVGEGGGQSQAASRKAVIRLANLNKAFAPWQRFPSQPLTGS